MAFSEVGAGSQRKTEITTSEVSTLDLVFPGNVTAGSLLVVMGTTYHSPAIATITVTDTRSTSYTVYSGTRTTEIRFFIAIGVAGSSGACTVTVDAVEATAYISAAIDEFAGTTPVISVDDGVTAVASNTSHVASITTATSNELVLGVIDWSAAGLTVAPGSGLTQIGETENALAELFSAEFIIAGAAGAVTVDWTTSVSCVSAIYAISVKETAGGIGAKGAIYNYMMNQ